MRKEFPCHDIIMECDMTPGITENKRAMQVLSLFRIIDFPLSVISGIYTECLLHPLTHVNLTQDQVTHRTLAWGGRVLQELTLTLKCEQSGCLLTNGNIKGCQTDSLYHCHWWEGSQSHKQPVLNFLSILIQISLNVFPCSNWQLVSNGSHYGLVLSGKKPLPKATTSKIYNAMRSLGHNDLTHLSLDKMDATTQTIFLDAFFKGSLKFVPKGPIDNNTTLV